MPLNDLSIHLSLTHIILAMSMNLTNIYASKHFYCVTIISLSFLLFFFFFVFRLNMEIVARFHTQCFERISDGTIYNYIISANFNNNLKHLNMIDDEHEIGGRKLHTRTRGLLVVDDELSTVKVEVDKEIKSSEKGKIEMIFHFVPTQFSRSLPLSKSSSSSSLSFIGIIC